MRQSIAQKRTNNKANEMYDPANQANAMGKEINNQRKKGARGILIAIGILLLAGLWVWSQLGG